MQSLLPFLANFGVKILQIIRNFTQNLLLVRSVNLILFGSSGPQNYFRQCILQVVITIGEQMVDVLAYRRPSEPEMLCCISSPALMKVYDRNFSHLLFIVCRILWRNNGGYRSTQIQQNSGLLLWPLGCKTSRALWPDVKGIPLYTTKRV